VDQWQQQKLVAETDAEQRQSVYKGALKTCVQKEVAMNLKRVHDEYMRNVKRLGWFVTQRYRTH